MQSGRSKKALRERGSTRLCKCGAPKKQLRHGQLVLWRRLSNQILDTQRMQAQAAELSYTFMTAFVRFYWRESGSKWEGKTEELSGAPKDLWGVWMWSASFDLLHRKSWLWWPLSALKTYECVISKIALKISSKRLCLPFVSFIITWKDSRLERGFFFSIIYSHFFLVLI